MPYGVDLHTHTCYSDGLDTPAQLLAKAAEQGLYSIAVTDHDTIEALPEAQQAGQHHGIDVLAGVELTVQYQDYQDIHILGYLFAPSDANLQAQLNHMRDYRAERGLEILSRVNLLLTQRGQAPLNRERVLQRARSALTRPHLAQELIAQGYVGNTEEAFRHFLTPCDVPKAKLCPETAFDLIAQAGGICSIAHPGTISADPEVLENLLATFKTMGLVGVEVYHHYHYPAYIDFFLGCARRYDLMVTGGSDYHGHQNGSVLGQIAPGRQIPDDVLIELRKFHAARP